MFTKIIGIIFILSITSLIGIYFSIKPKFRKSDLKSMKQGLEILKSEITYMSNSLLESSENIANRTVEPTKSIFLNFKINLERQKGLPLEEVWTETIIKNKDLTYFTIEDTENIKTLGKILGYADKNLNLSALNMLISYIDDKIGELEKFEFQNKKIYLSLGILSGLSIVIILI